MYQELQQKLNEYKKGFLQYIENLASIDNEALTDYVVDLFDEHLSKLIIGEPVDGYFSTVKNVLLELKEESIDYERRLILVNSLNLLLARLIRESKENKPPSLEPTITPNSLIEKFNKQAHLLSQIKFVLDENNISNMSSRILDLEVNCQDYTETFKKIADNLENTAALINNLDTVANSRIDDEDESVYNFDDNFKIAFHAINLSVTILDKPIMQSINIPFDSISWIAREIKSYPRRLRLVSGEVEKTYDSTVSLKDAIADFTQNNTVNTDFKWSRVH